MSQQPQMHQKGAVFDPEKTCKGGEERLYGMKGQGGASNDDKSIIIVADVTRGINQRCKKLEK
jgi:hypothetical protein